MATLRHVAVVLLCAALAGPVTAQYRGLESDGVIVYYEARDEAFARVASQAAVAALPTLRGALGIDPRTADRRPISITVVRTMTEFNRLVGREMDYNTQGVALPGRRIIVQTLAPVTMRAVVAHEIVHVLLDELSEPLHLVPPRWLHEGLAKYSTDDFTEVDREILGQAVVQRRLLRLHDLDAAFSGTQEQVALAYAESYTLVRYLDELKPGALSRFLHELADTGDLDRALLRTYGEPADVLERAWLSQVQEKYLKHGLELVSESIIFGIMALLFIVVYAVSLRRRRRIRERLQEEERLQRLFGGSDTAEGFTDDSEEDLEPEWPEFR